MYIARLRDLHGLRFELRRTIPVEDGLGFESLIDLGNNPASLVSFSRFGLRYDDVLLDTLDAYAVDLEVLDKLFAPFAPQGTSRFEARTKPWMRTRMTSTEEGVIRALHPFDRRRLAYLRTGEINLSRIDHVSPKMFKSLPGKCRDELEQMFLTMERSLPQREVRSYVYAAFNLQHHFTTLTARSMPEAQDEEQIDTAFVREYCLLRDDAAFWSGTDQAEAYVRRYAYMHFDFGFERGRGFGGIFEEFMNDFRRPQPRPKQVAPERVQELFGMNMAEIRSMSRREFARVFRKKAMSMHPDQGGDHDAFVELLETYKKIVSSKAE